MPFKMKETYNLGRVLLIIWFVLNSAQAQNKSEIKFFEGVPALYINEKK